MLKLVRALVFWGVIGAFVAALAHHALAWDKGAMNARVDASNFLLDNDCSATLIAPNKLLTANHCIVGQFETITKEKIEDGEVRQIKIKIATPGTVSRLSFSGPNQTTKVSYVYRIVAFDPASDLALVQTKVDAGDSPAPVACVAAERGDIVWAVGNPLVLLYASVTTGIVNSVNRDYQSLGLIQDDYRPDVDGTKGFVQHTALISAGSSGGALYNDAGELVGVNVRGGLGWALAVPLSDVRAFLQDSGAIAPCQ